MTEKMLHPTTPSIPAITPSPVPRVVRGVRTALLLALVASLSGCISLPFLIGGGAVATGVLVASDRRTSGTVLEDNSIELKGGGRVSDQLGDKVHVNLTSYNRKVLITGEVPTEQDKQTVEKIVATVENVAGIVNELEVIGNSTFSQRSSDSLVTSRVKANLLDTKDLFSNAFKITTERGIVYAMGRVTQREADRATEVIRQTSGVQRLVRVFEIISEDELAHSTQAPAPAAAGGAK